MLHAVGIDASVFDAIAVLIAVVMLGQLPIGPTAGAGAAVLILGPQGVVGAAAAGIMLTATGTIGGVLFAAWAGLDRLHSSRQVAAGRRDHAATVALHHAIARTAADAAAHHRERLLRRAQQRAHLAHAGPPQRRPGPTRPARASGSRSP